MNVLDTVIMAFDAIARNKVRSFLTTLGIVIGVASVIIMVHLGQATTVSVRNQISSLGSNLLIVRPGSGRRGPGGVRSQAPAFENEDVDAMRQEVRGATFAPTMVHPAILVYGNTNYTTTVTGTTREFLKVRDWQLARGRIFDPAEERAGTPVCVVGQTIVDELLGARPTLGESIRVGRVSCQIIGLLSPKGESMGRDQDDVVLMPLAAVQRRIAGRQDVDVIYVSADDENATARVQHDIETVLRGRRRILNGEEDDFNVRDMKEIAEAVESTTAALTALLGAIAAVSLLVGGIGIMNIMLVSVTERTREVGIRLAVGALSRDVLFQFLVEAVVLSTIGGMVGVVIGIAGTSLMTSQMNLPFIVVPETVLLAFGVSVAIGVIFGYVPARKAAFLDPIDALRHE
jgi:putative ABC transport system permease protein